MEQDREVPSAGQAASAMEKLADAGREAAEAMHALVAAMDRSR